MENNPKKTKKSCIEFTGKEYVVHNYSDAARNTAATALEDLASLLRRGAEVKSGGIIINECMGGKFLMNVEISFFVDGEK